MPPASSALTHSSLRSQRQPQQQPRQLAKERWWRDLTIVLTTSPVPSNPSTSVLEQVFQSFAKVPRLQEAQKLIHLDGTNPALPLRRRTSYAEFARRIALLISTAADFRHTQLHQSETYLFAAHNLAAAVQFVNTTFMLVHQHDFVIARPFDLKGLLRTMREKSHALKHVRLNVRPNVARGFDSFVENYTEGRVPLARTCGWSDCPHVTTKEYYTRFVIPKNRADHFNGARKFMEESLHYRMLRQGRPGGCWALQQAVARGETHLPWPRDFDDYGTYLYGYASARDGSYVEHRSLRGAQERWPTLQELGLKGTPRRRNRTHS